MDCELLATAKKIPLLIATSRQTVQTNPERAEQVTRKGAELLVFPGTPGRPNLNSVLDELSKRGVAQLLVEGGPTVISSFLKEQLADEFCIYIAPKILGRHGSVDIAGPMKKLTEAFDLNYVDIKNFDGDVRISGLSKKTLDELSITKR